MKILKLLLGVICCCGSIDAFAQSPKIIEADLLKSFKQINAWSDDTGMTANKSLWKAQKTVGEKLANYTRQVPSTINYPFNLLKKEHVNINTSKDGLFRIYSWDTWTGGTMHFFENVFQYKIGNKTYSVLDTVKQEGDSRPLYDKLYTLKVGNKTYYIAIYLIIESSRYYGEGVQCFSITQGKLNKDANIIKTGTGLHSKIIYEVDLGLNFDRKIRHSIYFDAKTNTLNIPLIELKGKMTNRYITYKFTGKYFEKVK